MGFGRGMRIHPTALSGLICVGPGLRIESGVQECSALGHAGSNREPVRGVDKNLREAGLERGRCKHRKPNLQEDRRAGPESLRDSNQTWREKPQAGRALFQQLPSSHRPGLGGTCASWSQPGGCRKFHSWS